MGSTNIIETESTTTSDTDSDINNKTKKTKRKNKHSIKNKQNPSSIKRKSIKNKSKEQEITEIKPNDTENDRTYKWVMTNDHDDEDSGKKIINQSDSIIKKSNNLTLESSPNELLNCIHKLEEELQIKNDIILNSKLEKDMQIKSLFQKVINLENDLQRERKRMNNLLDGKEKIIKRQEEKIVQLNETNSRLLAGLQRLKVHYTGSNSGNSSTSGAGQQGLNNPSGNSPTAPPGGQGSPEAPREEDGNSVNGGNPFGLQSEGEGVVIM